MDNEKMLRHVLRNNYEDVLNQIFEECYHDIVAYMTDTFRAKNHDYGSSTRDVYKDFKDSYMVRISDKYNRVRNLMKIGEENSQVTDEKLQDTILDMANYCVLWLTNILYEKRMYEDMNENDQEADQVEDDLKLDEAVEIKAKDGTWKI